MKRSQLPARKEVLNSLARRRVRLNPTGALFLHLPGFSKKEKRNRKRQRAHEQKQQHEYYHAMGDALRLHEHGRLRESLYILLFWHSRKVCHIHSYHGMLLRTLRKLVRSEINAHHYDVAYRYSQMLFERCEGYMTAYDQNTHDKILFAIRQSRNGDAQPESIADPMVGHEYQVEGDLVGIECVAASRHPKRTFDSGLRNVEYLQTCLNGEFYAQELGSGPLEKGANWKTVIIFKPTSAADQPDEMESVTFEVTGRLFKFAAAVSGKRFAAFTRSRQLLLCSLSSGVIAHIDLRSKIETEYEVRCLKMDASGEFLLLTYRDCAYVFDSSLNTISQYEIPDKIAVMKAHYAEEYVVETHTKTVDLAVLDLTRKATEEEIRAAYRKQLLQLHPDVNRDDPLACQKTCEVIQAYKNLTGKSTRECISESRLDISIPFSLGDWIYAALIQSEDNTLILGCYSGTLYFITATGDVHLIAVCPGTVREITRCGELLFVNCDGTRPGDALYVFHGLDCVGRILDDFIPQVRVHADTSWYMNNGVALQKDQTIQFYTVTGVPAGKLMFSTRIRGARWFDGEMIIDTPNASYRFKVALKAQLPAHDKIIGHLPLRLGKRKVSTILQNR